MFGVSKKALGGIILGIGMLAMFGARSANNWLSNSTQDTTEERIAAGSNNTASDADRFNSQSDGVFDDQTIDQADREIDRAIDQRNLANDAGDRNTDSTAGQNLTYPALDEAGSYIQRQKRVEEDSIIADTTFNVIPNADGAPVASTGDSRVPNQPSAPEQPSSSTNTTTPNTTTTEPATSSQPAVPALW